MTGLLSINQSTKTFSIPDFSISFPPIDPSAALMSYFPNSTIICFLLMDPWFCWRFSLLQGGRQPQPCHLIDALLAPKGNGCADWSGWLWFQCQCQWRILVDCSSSLLGELAGKPQEAQHLEFWYVLHVEVNMVEDISDIISGHKNGPILRIFLKDIL